MIYISLRPIHDAIEAGDLTIVRLLVEHGADLMAEQGGKTPTDLAKSLGLSEISAYLDGKFKIYLIIYYKSHFIFQICYVTKAKERGKMIQLVKLSSLH